VSVWRRPALVGLAGKGVELLTLVPLVTVLPRFFGPADYGDFALALSVVTLSSASVALGGPTLVSRYVAAAPDGDRRTLALALGLRSVVWRLALGVVVAVVALIALATDSATPSGAVLAFVLLAFLLDVVATVVFQTGLAVGQVTLWSARYPVQNTVLVVVALCGYAVFGLVGAMAALPVSSGFALAQGLAGVAPAFRNVRPRRSLPAGVGRFAVIQGLSGALVQLVHRGPVLFVALLGAGAAETGYAALATGVALAATYAVWQSFAVELPRLAALGVGADIRSTSRLAWAALAMLTPLAALGAVLAQPLVPLLAGERYRPAATTLGLALAILPLAPIGAAVNQAAALRYRPELRFASAAAGAAAFVISCLLLVPSLEAEGGAAALVVGSAAAALVGGIAVSDALGRLLPAASLASAGVVVLIAVAV